MYNAQYSHLASTKNTIIMKNLKTLILFLFIGLTANVAKATSPEAANYTKYDGKAYIFIENGVEFSVFPDGQFDFVYVGPQNSTEVVISTPGVNVSFNAGYDYEAYAQYDDYGAIIQVEDVPVFYDEFGRIIQAGTVDISYRNRRLVRVGGLNIFYNNFGYYDYCTGFINPFNRFYVYRPWHIYYVRPIYSNCIVWDIPYRRYYTPIRYSYYNHVRFYNNRFVTPYNNCRRDFYRPGSRVHYRNGRTALNRDFREGRRNTMVTNHGRRDAALARTNTFRKTDATASRNTRRGNNANVNRSERTTAKRSTSSRTSRGIASKRKDRNNNSAISSRSTTRNKSRNIAQNTRKSPKNVRSTSRNNVRTYKPNSRDIQKRTSSNRVSKVRSPRKAKPVTKTNRSGSRNKTARPSRISNTRKSATRTGSRNNARGKTRSSAPRRERGL